MSVTCIREDIWVSAVDHSRVELVIQDDNPDHPDEDYVQLSPDAAIELAKELVMAAYEAKGEAPADVYISVVGVDGAMEDA